LLSPANEAALTSRIETIREQYDFDVAIRTVDSLEGQTPQRANESYYRDSGYGPDGISLLVAMGSRDWDIWATPGRGQEKFTDYGLGLIGQEVQELLSQGDYYLAFDSFLGLVGDFLQEAQSDRPYDSDHHYLTYNPLLWALAIGGGIGAISAGLIIAWWKHNLKTARPATAAASYQAPGSLNFSRQEDKLVSSHTAVVPLPPPSSSHGSGGGGGISVGGGHASGKF
jgi:uncharacterized protein